MSSTVVPATQAARAFSLPLESSSPGTRIRTGGGPPVAPVIRQPATGAAFGRGSVGSGFGRRAAYGLRATPSNETRQLVSVASCFPA